MALSLILLNRLLDGLDGAVARIAGPTDRGAYLDIAFDMVFYALIPLGFALQAPETHALPAAVLIVSFVGTGSSFLAFSAVAAKLGRKAADFPTKASITPADWQKVSKTIALFVAMCLLPASFPVIAYGFAALCAVTNSHSLATGVGGAFSEAEH